MQLTIFVTDDEPAIRYAIVKRLTRKQHRVVGFESGETLLAALHQDNNSAAELCQRREQCEQLRTERQSQIEIQVRLAFIDQNTAIARLSIAQQQAEQVSQLTRQSVIAIELDQAKPGTDLLAKLEQLQAQGRVIERQTALSLAAVKLRESMGTTIAD